MRRHFITLWLALPILVACLLPSLAGAQAQDLPDWVKSIPRLLNQPAGQPDKKFQEVNKAFKESLAALFRARVLGLRELEFFRGVFEQISENPGKFNFDPALLKKFDLDHQNTREMLRKWKLLHGGRLDQDSVAELKNILKPPSPEFTLKYMTGLGGLGGMPLGPGIPMLRPPSSTQTPEAMPRWMRDFLRSTERSRLGEYLKKSPSWNKNVAQLRGALNLDQSQATWRNLAERWKLDSLRIPGSQGLLDRLNNLSLPDWNRSVSVLPGVSLPGLYAPAFSLPSMPGPGNWQGAEAYLWPILLLILVICAWRFFRNPRRKSETWIIEELGPWPVDVAAISSRADLIKAFEYLALLRLGAAARTWNHRLIAAQWTLAQTENQSLRDAASRLAGLYELARYSDSDAPLDQDAQQQARRALAEIASAPA